MASIGHDSWLASLQGPAFSMLHEASLTSGLLLSCWCPSMDLVAVVSADSQLSVHRLNWQRLWAISLDCPVTALCWHPEGKVLATGTAAGKVRLYDVERCELVHQVPASPSPAHAITHLQWVDTPPSSIPPSIYQQVCRCFQSIFRQASWADKGSQASYSKLSRYRHMRLFSKPSQQPAATDAAASLDLSVMPEAQRWPPPPSALSVLVATNDQGDITLWGLGTFPLACIQLTSALQHVQPAVEGSHVEQAGAVGLDRAWGSEAGESCVGEPQQLQVSKASSCVSADLQWVVQAWSVGMGSNTCIHARVLSNKAVAASHATLLQLAVLFRDLMESLAGATAALQKAGQTWSAAHGELAKSLDSLKAALAEHMPPSQQADEAVYGVDETEPDVQGEFVCMLAAGHVGPGMLTWLTSTLQEHGLRRLAQQIDTALSGIHSSLLHQVKPHLELATFLLGELRGLAHPLLGATGAHRLGLQVQVCADAELQAVKAMLQCETMISHVSCLSAQYRSFFTWLLKTVLLLEYDGAPAQTTGPANAVEGPAAVTAAAVSMTVDVESVLQLLEGQLLQDSIGPDICEGWFDHDIQPASLSFDPALPLEGLQKLMALMYPKSGDPTIPKPKQSLHTDALRVGSQRFAATARQLHQDAAPVSDQGSRSVPAHDAGADVVAPAAEMEERVREVWPSKPLRKQLQAVVELMTGLRDHLSRTISPQYQPAVQVVVLPSISNSHSIAGSAHADQAGSRQQWFVHASPSQQAAQAAAANKELTSDNLMMVTLVSPAHLTVLKGALQQEQASINGSTFNTQAHQQGILYCRFCPSHHTPTTEAAGLQNTDVAEGGSQLSTVEAMLLLLPIGCHLQEITQYKDGYTAALLQSDRSTSMHQYAGEQTADDMLDDTSPSKQEQQQSMHLVLLPPPVLHSLPHYQQPSILQACLAAGAVRMLGADDEAGNGQTRARLIASCKCSSPTVRSAAISLLGSPSLTVSGPRGVALLCMSRPHRVQLLDLEEDEVGDGQEEGEE